MRICVYKKFTNKFAYHVKSGLTKDLTGGIILDVILVHTFEVRA